MLGLVLVVVSLSDVLPYLDPTKPIAARVNDLLGWLTTEEAVGQLQQWNGEFPLDLSMSQQPGSILSVLGDRVREIMLRGNETRLRIPILFGIDAIHGHSFWPGATIFPTQLGAAQSWDEELLEMQGNITAFEMRYTGPAWAFSPVLYIARDARWGRVGETFGEDPMLIGRFASALIRGLQGPMGSPATPTR